MNVELKVSESAGTASVVSSGAWAEAQTTTPMTHAARISVTLEGLT